MEPATAGASLSGEEKAEVLLCKLSFEDFGLRVCVDMVVKLWFCLLWKMIAGNVEGVFVQIFVLNVAKVEL
jgi:hypothetical protein